MICNDSSVRPSIRKRAWRNVVLTWATNMIVIVTFEQSGSSWVPWKNNRRLPYCPMFSRGGLVCCGYSCHCSIQGYSYGIRGHCNRRSSTQAKVGRLLGTGWRLFRCDWRSSKEGRGAHRWILARSWIRSRWWLKYLMLVRRFPRWGSLRRGCRDNLKCWGEIRNLRWKVQ